MYTISERTHKLVHYTSPYDNPQFYDAKNFLSKFNPPIK